jgi:hypothetical protein
LKEQFGVAELTSFGLDGHPHAMAASGAIVHYLRENAARGSGFVLTNPELNKSNSNCPLLFIAKQTSLVSRTKLKCAWR